MDPDRILVFAKRPAPGRVKTRLTPALSPEQAAAVYEACLEDVVALAARHGARVELWYRAEADAERFFAERFPDLPRRTQPEGGLGARLEGAFQRAFAEGAARVVVLGSDSPTLPARVLGEAFDALADDDAAIGPARDGGYYLLGLRRAAWPAAAALFRDIPWSTEDVLRRTLAAAGGAGLAVHTLPGWYDIDEVADLERAAADLPPDSRLARWIERSDRDA